ncbi:M56 family metallopeptidase [Psychroserpens sp. Hel_I_66]|uniref:M56 family metallopeptidase n=1 Tax=Psychroserpens sp. Hel_I_66 TaxID=1250004 RepID=UPI00068C0A60|nr:M56 family metallopeptidase [Psychroserpens sp. Hel_I_66]
MLHYIIQVVAFQLLFLIIYDLFLRKETFFTLNRIYLLSTSILSLVIPFVKIERIKEVVPKDFVISLPEVLIGDTTKPASAIDPTTTLEAGINIGPQPVSIWNIILISGMCVAALILVYKIIKLFLLVSKNPKYRNGKVLIISLLNSTKAFSFFNYIFLGNRLTAKESTSILEHEMVHIKQNHSLDLLFFELSRIVFWFNPLVYIYQNRIATVHEYIADAKAVKGKNKADYYDNLLIQVFETQQFSFVNPFFKKSLIKKRIVMLSKSKSKQINLVKYALLIPMVFTMLIYTSSYAQDKITTSSEIENQDTQELTDEELKQKLYEELVEMEKDGKSSIEIKNFIMNNDTHKYLKSRIEYYKLGVYMTYMLESAKKRNSENSSSSENFAELENSLSNQRTYKEYVEWKKTDEAKSSWENKNIDGVLKLFVEDLNNLTSEERKKRAEKLELLNTNDFYHKLIVSDYYDSNVFDFGKEKNTFKFNTNDDIEIIEVDENIEVPFAIIEETPTFTFCESLETNQERKECMSDNISKHVATNFNTKLADSLGLTGRQRINVVFKIDKQGDIIDVKSRASHPALEEEAIRVIKTLPQLVPGKQKGKAVVVPYSLPIIFQVKADNTNASENTNLNDIIKSLKESLANSVNSQVKKILFSEVDQVPMHEACAGLTSNEDQKKCISNEISMFVNKNFNLDLASKLGLKGRQQISALFAINKNGETQDIKVRAPHPELEKETERVIKALPQFIPGMHNGKSVTVMYSLPILFQVADDTKDNKKN